MIHITEQHDEIQEIVDKLYTLGMLKTDDLKKFKEYRDGLESEIRTLNFALKHGHSSNPEATQTRIDELQSELDWVNQTTIYRGDHVELLDMHSMVSHMLWTRKGSIWDFKKLVEMVNAYYEIFEPYNTSYRIAYGWKFALEKENFRPYLLGCIRNYLKKNDVEFDTADLQRICALRDDNLQ